MPIPQFNSMELFSAAARELPESPRLRTYLETLPGADGVYVQPHGTAERVIRCSGLLSGSNNSAWLAQAALKSHLRDRQALADGATVADFVGVDDHRYADCLLQSYTPVGTVQVSRNSDSSYTAYVRCVATLLQLVARS
ncbi:MAG: hypothetical protein ACOC93_03460 [Planctomycetota bacterium]